MASRVVAAICAGVVVVAVAWAVDSSDATTCGLVVTIYSRSVAMAACGRGSSHGHRCVPGVPFWCFNRIFVEAACAAAETIFPELPRSHNCWCGVVAIAIVWSIDAGAAVALSVAAAPEPLAIALAV